MPQHCSGIRTYVLALTAVLLTGVPAAFAQPIGTGAMGTVAVEADDGTGNFPAGGGPVAIDKTRPLERKAPKGGASAIGTAVEWNLIKGSIDAAKKAGAPNPGKCKSTITVDSKLPWKGKKAQTFIIEVMVKLKADLDNKSNPATVEAAVTLSDGLSATAGTTYKISHDNANPGNVIVEDNKNLKISVASNTEKQYSFKSERINFPSVETEQTYKLNFVVKISGESTGEAKVDVSEVIFHFKSV